MATSINPRYTVQNPDETQGLSSSVTVVRNSDSASFLASKIPNVVTKDYNKVTYDTSLASAILPTAGVPLSRILNHPNIISLVDIVHTSALAGSVSQAGKYGDVTVWEDMDAGTLEYLLPRSESLPAFTDTTGWHALSHQNYQRFSLPESLCWHVLRSISRALLWLHEGIKHSGGKQVERKKLDNDWQPILIMDVSPGQIWFQKPKGKETYGACKLGGFHYAKVTGFPGGRIAVASRVEDAPRGKQMYWAPEVYKNVYSPSRSSEVWSLGAVIYCMMTGLPPPRLYEYNWQISRMNDRGSSEEIREIVGKMLMPHPSDRPTALSLVDDIDDNWEKWRSETREGLQFVDIDDERWEVW